MALKCKNLKLGKVHIVFQKVRIYAKYESAVANVPKLKLPFFVTHGKDKLLGKLYKLNYEIQHGDIKEGWLVYVNKSNYDTHVFETMLKGGVENEINEKA